MPGLQQFLQLIEPGLGFKNPVARIEEGLSVDRFDITDVCHGDFIPVCAHGAGKTALTGFDKGGDLAYLVRDLAAADQDELLILVSDLFVIGGVQWAINNVATTAPAEAPVLYAVELKSQGSADG